MDASLTIAGLDELGDAIRALEVAIADELESAGADIGARIRGRAANLAPFDEGRLRSSIEEVVERLGAHMVQVAVGSNVEYAPYQEFGTKFMDGQPYLRPALEAEKDWIIDRVEEGVESAFDSVGLDGGLPG